MVRRAARAALVAAAALLLPGTASADILQMKDGRIVDGVKLRRDGEELVVEYRSGNVRVPMEMVEDYVLEAGEAAPTPAGSAGEGRPDGQVLFRGKWMKPDARDRAVREEIAKRRKAIDEYRKHREWRNRYKFATKNFEFESTLRPEINEEFSALLEAYFTEFGKLWGTRVPRDWGKLKVCFYSDPAEFQRTGGVSGGVLAYYRFVAPRELNFFYDRRGKDLTISYLFHEANHYLTDLMDEKFQYPHWLNEGMAEYYGASRWDPVKRTMSVGHIQEGRLVELRADIEAEKLLSLRDLVTSEAQDYRHYYWGWSFMHFMMQSPKYQKRFQKFFADLATARDIERRPMMAQFTQVSGEECLRAFQTRLGVKDLDELQKEWYAHIASLPAGGLRGLEQAGLRAFANGMRAFRAPRLLKEALDAGSRDIQVHLAYATCLASKPEGREEALRVMERACALDPLDGDTWAYRGYALVAMGRQEEGARMLELAKEMNPDEDYLMLEILFKLGSTGGDRQ